MVIGAQIVIGTGFPSLFKNICIFYYAESLHLSIIWYFGSIDTHEYGFNFMLYSQSEAINKKYSQGNH